VIGHDCVIGSNVWLTRSVQPHTTVVLEKPKLRIRAEVEELKSDFDYVI
jgi:serine O-acetyltransferase